MAALSMAPLFPSWRTLVGPRPSVVAEARVAPVGEPGTTAGKRPGAASARGSAGHTTMTQTAHDVLTDRKDRPWPVDW